MEQDPLVFIPRDRWSEIQELFKADWPRGVVGFSCLETQKSWEDHGLGYGFKVYCPFGDVSNGMVCLNDKGQDYEIVIQCPKDDTSKLEEAIKQTKVIEWSRSRITVPTTPPHIIGVLKRIAAHFDKDYMDVYTEGFFLPSERPLFEVSLPQGVTFKQLSEDQAEFVESKWPHSYPGAVEYFKFILRAKTGYGLYENDKLAAWMLITESGCFFNLYTLEEFRRKGYAELVVKLISNLLKRDNKNAYGFVVKGNTNSFKLFEKLKFSNFGDIAWCFLSNKKENST